VGTNKSASDNNGVAYSENLGVNYAQRPEIAGKTLNLWRNVSWRVWDWAQWQNCQWWLRMSA